VVGIEDPTDAELTTLTVDDVAVEAGSGADPAADAGGSDPR
jgi:hypothetical protein